jgi:hypothetical protein
MTLVLVSDDESEYRTATDIDPPDEPGMCLSSCAAVDRSLHQPHAANHKQPGLQTLHRVPASNPI